MPKRSAVFRFLTRATCFTACSFFNLRSPDVPRLGQLPNCDDTSHFPAIDTVAAVVLGALAVGAIVVGGVESGKDRCVDGCPGGHYVGGLALSMGAVTYGISALYGRHKQNECRALKTAR